MLNHSLFRSLCGLHLHVHARSLAKLDLSYWHSRLSLLLACTCSSMHSVQRPAKRSRIKWCRLSLAALTSLIFCHDSIHSKKTKIYILLLLCTLGAMYVLVLRRGRVFNSNEHRQFVSLKINDGKCRRLLMIADLTSRTKLGTHVHAHDLTQGMKWHHSSTRMPTVMIKGEQIYRPGYIFVISLNFQQVVWCWRGKGELQSSRAESQRTDKLVSFTLCFTTR